MSEDWNENPGDFAREWLRGPQRDETIYEMESQRGKFRLTTTAIEALTARIAQVEAERDFLLARAGRAGSAYFGRGRWTGISSNALVTVAFGGEDASLPSDTSDLAACYRTMLRLPKHLLSNKVWQQLEVGEAYVASKYDIQWARDDAGWTDDAIRALKDTRHD